MQTIINARPEALVLPEDEDEDEKVDDKNL